METVVTEIENITGILEVLPASALHEIRDFAFYLADREKRRKALVERIRKAEENPDAVICNSAEEAMQAIYSAQGDDEA